MQAIPHLTIAANDLQKGVGTPIADFQKCPLSSSKWRRLDGIMFILRKKHSFWKDLHIKGRVYVFLFANWMSPH